MTDSNDEIYAYREDPCSYEDEKHTYVFKGREAPTQWSMKYECPKLLKWLSYETELKAWRFKTTLNTTDVFLIKVKRNFTIPT